MPTIQATKPTARRRRPVAAAVPSGVFSRYVGTLRAKPQDRRKMSLGNYCPETPAKGYAIKLRSRADINDPAISAEVVMTGSSKRYEMTLYLANGTDKSVSAEVWQIP